MPSRFQLIYKLCLRLRHADRDDLVVGATRAARRALVRTNGNVSKAAKDLDISRATLHRRLKQLGLHR